MDKGVCCPKFDPKKWDGKVLTWKNKKFVKGNVFTFFYIPLNFGSVITKLMQKIDAAHVCCVDYLCLSDHISPWWMDLYLAVDALVPSVENVTLQGKFLCKVYEGSFKETGRWCKDFEVYAQRKKFSTKKLYLWYTTCPKCAKKYGKNYVVVVGRRSQDL